MAKNLERLKCYPKRKSAGMEKNEENNATNLDLDSFKEGLLEDLKKVIDDRLTELANHVFQRIDEIEKVVINNEKITTKRFLYHKYKLKIIFVRLIFFLCP